MRGASVIAILIAALAVALVARGQSEPRVPMLIATALAIGLAVLLGMASVTLIFLGKRSGHQPDAGADPFESNES
jgi:cation transporter-like permease